MPILALDMYEHAFHMDFGANAGAYVDTFLRNIDWKGVAARYEDAIKVEPLRPLEQKEFGNVPGVADLGYVVEAAGIELKGVEQD